MTGFVHSAGEGAAYEWHDSLMVIKASSADTHGQLAVIESTYPAGLVVPAHVHDGEDEMFYLLDGELGGFCADDEWTAHPGDFVFVPRNSRHGFTVLGGQQARALVVVGPSRLDQQIAATGTAVRKHD